MKHNGGSMKKILGIAFCLCLITMLCYAEKMYIYIDKIGYVEKGQEAGHTEKGDVVAVVPFTSQYKPTRAELDRYQIIVVDITKEEGEMLLEPVTDGSGLDSEPIIKCKKRKIDYENFSDKKQEQEAEISKTVFLDNLSTKSIPIL